MKRWLVPIIFSFISIAAFLLSGIGGALRNGDGTGYGGLVIVLFGLIVYCVIVIPAMCLLYSKHCLSGQRFRFLFTFYQSLLVTLPYFIWFSEDHKTMVYGIILFIWCELWALLGLVKRRESMIKPKLK